MIGRRRCHAWHAELSQKAATTCGTSGSPCGASQSSSPPSLRTMGSPPAAPAPLPLPPPALPPPPPPLPPLPEAQPPSSAAASCSSIMRSTSSALRPLTGAPCARSTSCRPRISVFCSSVADSGRRSEGPAYTEAFDETWQYIELAKSRTCSPFRLISPNSILL